MTETCCCEFIDFIWMDYDWEPFFKTYLIFSLAYRFKEVRGTPLDTYNYDCYLPVDVRINILSYDYLWICYFIKLVIQVY